MMNDNFHAKFGKVRNRTASFSKVNKMVVKMYG